MGTIASIYLSIHKLDLGMCFKLKTVGEENMSGIQKRDVDGDNFWQRSAPAVKVIGSHISSLTCSKKTGGCHSSESPM